MAFKPLVFSGVQPTGNLHLGNYLGAIKRFVALQDDARLHLLRRRPARDHRLAGPGGADSARSARSPRPSSPPASTRRRTSSSTRARCPQHAELAWIFNCVARMGWLNRMTQFKEKAGKDRENASVGLFAYPSADGRRHPGLPGHPRAGRRGPEAASRADARHRPEVQQRLRRPRSPPRGHDATRASSRCPSR